jgi:hypothetical protein
LLILVRQKAESIARNTPIVPWDLPRECAAGPSNVATSCDWIVLHTIPHIFCNFLLAFIFYCGNNSRNICSLGEAETQSKG